MKTEKRKELEQKAGEELGSWDKGDLIQIIIDEMSDKELADFVEDNR